MVTFLKFSLSYFFYIFIRYILICFSFLIMNILPKPQLSRKEECSDMLEEHSSIQFIPTWMVYLSDQENRALETSKRHLESILGSFYITRQYSWASYTSIHSTSAYVLRLHTEVKIILIWTHSLIHWHQSPSDSVISVSMGSLWFGNIW